MGFRVDDAVRLRPRSELGEMLGAWSDATGRVAAAVFEDMAPVRLNVLYSEEGPLVSTAIAAEFVPDVPLDAAPF